MKVSELIKELEKFLSEEGDLDVKIYADHEQTHMNADLVSLAFTEDNEEYMSEATQYNYYIN